MFNISYQCGLDLSGVGIGRFVSQLWRTKDWEIVMHQYQHQYISISRTFSSLALQILDVIV